MLSSPSIEKVSGIYKIVNKINGKYYVGSSHNISGKGEYSRWNHHRKKLRQNKHDNDFLQHAWNKYGENNFELVIAEKVANPSMLLEVEQKYLNIAKTEQDKCYNLKFEAMGGQWSEHSRDKMRGSNNPKFGKHLTEEEKQALSEFNKGKILANDTKRKISEARKGMIFSIEHRQNISKSKSGIKNPNFGKPLSEEHRRRISESRRKQKRVSVFPAHNMNQ